MSNPWDSNNGGQLSRDNGAPSRNLMWGIIVALIVLIVLALVALFFIWKADQEDYVGVATATKSTSTVTATAAAEPARPSKDPVKEETSSSTSAKGSCSVETFEKVLGRTDFLGPSCDGEWAAINIYKSTEVAIFRWNGSQWENMRVNGEEYTNCISGSWVKEHGVPASVYPDSNVCTRELKSTTKATSTATESLTTSESSTTSESTAAETAEGDICAPSSFAEQEIHTDSRIGEVVVDYCDGEWAQWGIYGVGGKVISKRNGDSWEDFMRINESSTTDEICQQIEYGKQQGMPEEISSQHGECA